MNETTKSVYKYQIPRNVKAKFELFGLSVKKGILMLPFLAVAFLLFKILSGPPQVIFPIIIVGGSWMAMTKEMDGETVYEIAENIFLDFFRPRHHYWEEVDHAQYYKRAFRDEEREETNE